MKKGHKFLKRYLVALIGCVLCCQVAAGRTPPQRSAQAGETEAARLRKRAEGAQQAGRYDEALAIALRAMALDEKERGPNHPAYWASFFQSGRWASLNDGQPSAR